MRCRYVGFALTTQWEGQAREKLQVIGFDMGGTSTDVSRYAGSYEHVFESTTAGIAAQLTGRVAVCRHIPDLEIPALCAGDSHVPGPACLLQTAALPLLLSLFP